MPTESKVPVIRLRLPCQSALEFYGTYAKQLAGAFFVAQDLPTEEETQVNVHVSLTGANLELLGQGTATPTTKKDRRGIVIQLETLEEVRGGEDDEGDDPFNDSVTRASNVPGQIAAQLRQSLNLSGVRGPNIVRREELSQESNPVSGEDVLELDASVSMDRRSGQYEAARPPSSEPEPEPEEPAGEAQATKENELDAAKNEEPEDEDAEPEDEAREESGVKESTFSLEGAGADRAAAEDAGEDSDARSPEHVRAGAPRFSAVLLVGAAFALLVLASWYFRDDLAAFYRQLLE